MVSSGSRVAHNRAVYYPQSALQHTVLQRSTSWQSKLVVMSVSQSEARKQRTSSILWHEPGKGVGEPQQERRTFF